MDCHRNHLSTGCCGSLLALIRSAEEKQVRGFSHFGGCLLSELLDTWRSVCTTSQVLCQAQFLAQTLFKGKDSGACGSLACDPSDSTR